MNIDRLLLFLTEYEKIALHYFYPSQIKEYNRLNADMGNAVEGLINLGLLEESKNIEGDKLYKLTRNGRILCDVILEKP